MPAELRILLVLISILSLIVIIKQIRAAKVQIEYAIFWIVFSAVLVIMAVFPKIFIGMSDFLKIQSPANMIFLVIIFVLILKLFRMNIQMSALEYKMRELVQKIAVSEFEKKESMEKSSEDGQECHTKDGYLNAKNEEKKDKQ